MALPQAGHAQEKGHGEPWRFEIGKYFIRKPGDPVDISLIKADGGKEYSMKLTNLFVAAP